VVGGAAPLLPADPAKLSHVVIVGNLASTVTLDGYSGDPLPQVNAGTLVASTHWNTSDPAGGLTAVVGAAIPASAIAVTRSRLGSCGLYDKLNTWLRNHRVDGQPPGPTAEPTAPIPIDRRRQAEP
jgi:hypothetical protein